MSCDHFLGIFVTIDLITNWTFNIFKSLSYYKILLGCACLWADVFDAKVYTTMLWNLSGKDKIVWISSHIYFTKGGQKLQFFLFCTLKKISFSFWVRIRLFCCSNYSFMILGVLNARQKWTRIYPRGLENKNLLLNFDKYFNFSPLNFATKNWWLTRSPLSIDVLFDDFISISIQVTSCFLATCSYAYAYLQFFLYTWN